MEFHSYPKQRLSFYQKTKNKYDWAKKMIDYFEREWGSFDLSVSETVRRNYDSFEEYDYHRKLSNYMLYNNMLDQRDFEREANPLGIEVGQLKDEVKAYNKTYTKIDYLLGEEAKRPFNYRTVLKGEEGYNVRRKKKIELQYQYLSNAIQQEMMRIQEQVQAQSEGQDPNDPQVQEQIQQKIQQEFDKVMSPEEIEQYMKKEYKSPKEKQVMAILEVMKNKLSIRDLMNDSFKHALIAGEEILWVGEVNGQPVIEVVNPIGFFYHKGNDVKFIEDGLYAGRKVKMTVQDILERYGDYLEKKDIEKLMGNEVGVGGMDEDLISPQMKKYDYWDNFGKYFKGKPVEEIGQYGSDGLEDDVDVLHVEWRSEKKIGYFRYYDEDFTERVDIVDETFKFDKENPYHISIEWEWIPEIWEGVKIGADIYCCMQPKRNQFHTTTNPKRAKLGYHGMVYNNTNSNNVSIMDRMKPFQYLYFVIMHKAKRLFALDQGKVWTLNTSLIDPDIGLEKTLWYLKEMNINVINPYAMMDDPKYGAVFGKVQQSLVEDAVDMSTIQHVMQIAQFLDWLDMQIGESAGVTKHREGQTSQYDPVTNVQQNLVQQSYITEPLYHKHNKVWERILNSLVELAQMIYQENPEKATYILDEQSVGIVSMDGDIANSEFEVYVKDNTKENAIFENLRALAQPMMQNGVQISQIVKILRADSIEDLAREIEQIEAQRMKQAEQQAQADRELQDKMSQRQQQTEAAKMSQERYLTESTNVRDNETKYKIAAMQILGTDNEDDAQVLEMMKFLKESEQKDRELTEQERKNRVDEILQRRELAIKARQAAQKKTQ